MAPGAPFGIRHDGKSRIGTRIGKIRICERKTDREQVSLEDQNPELLSI